MKTSSLAEFRFLTLLFLLVYFANGALAYELPANVKAQRFINLSFSDEFEELSLGGTNSIWNNALWYEKENDVSLYSVRDGVLSIAADRNNTSVSLTTVSRQGKGQLFKTGYFVARMRWEDKPHVWAAFWLFSYQHMMGTDQKRWCEIDIIESMKKHVFTGTVHNWVDFTTEMNCNNDHPVGLNYNPSEWHDYGALVTADTIEWYLDGVPLFSANKPDVCKNNELFLILSSQIHKDDRGRASADSGGQERSVVQFDWVRVYTQ